MTEEQMSSPRTDYSVDELPTSDLVGVTREWSLPITADRTVTLTADFIGFASSLRTDHEGHPGAEFGLIKTRCRACRWFEPRIFREVPDPERYLILFTGRTIIPGESTHTRLEWAHSGEEVIAALSSPTPNTLSKCPVCDGTGLVSRPPGTAGDMNTWSSTAQGPYPCRACKDGVITIKSVRFTIPATRVIQQASSFDEEIKEAWALANDIRHIVRPV